MITISRINRILLTILFLAIVSTMSFFVYFETKPYGGYFVAGSISFINHSIFVTNGQNLVCGNLIAASIYYDYNKYKAVIGAGNDNSNSSGAVWVLTDFQTNKPAQTLKWVNFAPMQDFKQGIMLNPVLDFLYNNEKAGIFLAYQSL